MEIFVFGSNTAGRHGRGAAYEALCDWDAEYGVGRGPTGRAYAIPTKDSRLNTLPLKFIKKEVEKFLEYASQSNDTFLVTPIGTGLAGYSEDEIRPMFRPMENIRYIGWKEKPK